MESHHKNSRSYLGTHVRRQYCQPALVPPEVWNRTYRWEKHPIRHRLTERLSHLFNEHYNSESDVPKTPSYSSSGSL